MADEKTPIPVDRLTCILCPVGCEIEAARTERGLDVRGHMCEKGVEFATDEILHPRRNLATSVPAGGRPSTMISVRLSGAVPRDMLFAILAEIGKLRPALPVARGQVLIANVLGSGVDVIATRSVRSEL